MILTDFGDSMIVRTSKSAYYLSSGLQRVEIPGVVYVSFGISRRVRTSVGGLTHTGGLRVFGELGLISISSVLNLYNQQLSSNTPRHDLYVPFTEGDQGKILFFSLPVYGAGSSSASLFGTFKGLVYEGKIVVQRLPFQLAVSESLLTADVVKILDDPDA